jgi:hypothetical protein
VGDKKSSHAITDEYAKADPIYVAKTAVRPPQLFLPHIAKQPLGITADLLSLPTYTG